MSGVLQAITLCGLGNLLQHSYFSGTCVALILTLTATIVSIVVDIIIVPDSLFSRLLPGGHSLISTLSVTQPTLTADPLPMLLYLSVALAIIPQLVTQISRLSMCCYNQRIDEVEEEDPKREITVSF